MLKKIDKEVFSRISEDTFNNIIYSNYTKCIGIESDNRIINENNKRVGKIIFIHYSETIPVNKIKKSLDLGMFVEFKEEKGTFQSRIVSDGTQVGIWLVDPYFVKAYKPDPKIEVPVQILDIKTNQIVTEMRQLTYKQFQENRLNLFFYNSKWQTRWSDAYKNFRKMFAKTGLYYLAINSTVKNYLISQSDLKSILAQVDNQKRKIKSEWTRCLNQNLQTNEAMKSIQALIDKESLKQEKGNVVNLSNFSL